MGENINYNITLISSKPPKEAEWSLSIFKLNAGTVLDTDCRYKSCQLVHTWTRENFGESLNDVSIKTGEELVAWGNTFPESGRKDLSLRCTKASSSWKTSLAIVNLSKLAFKNLINSQQSLAKSVSRIYPPVNF